MKILSIDTSSPVCSVALLEDNKQIKELNIVNTKTHSENLMPLVKELLDSTNCSLADVGLIVCDKGPGSFTGIRIGISSVKAMAEVYNIPVASVSSLEGLAYNENIGSGILCPMIDARNDHVYCALFDVEHNIISEYLADHVDEIIKILKNNNYTEITFIGDGAILHENLLKTSFSNCNISFSGNNILHATNVGICGLKKYLQEDYQNADTVLPMYVRKSRS